jgi:NUMOD4 motif
MLETWEIIEEFPDYMVSDLGRVANRSTGQLLTMSLVQYGVPTVGLMRDDKQHRRSVPMLVAKTFLPAPPREDFDTPIHLDGNRSNCKADNLMWRPRWFAIRFHRERRIGQYEEWPVLVQNQNTGEVFRSIKECARVYGLLETELHLGIANKEPVFPEGAYFRFIQ